ncbi:MAG: PAC2 family protein [Actinobacteria bacterium]|nr:PAC2 family protein [Actinomycetota bacterium]
MTVQPPDDLYEIYSEDIPPGLVLIHNLTGFLDAGAAGGLAVNHLLTTLESEVVVRFDIDALFDYRARRPRMTFLGDHYGQIDMPDLVISMLRDQTDTPFLLMHGPEPDFGWRRFAAAVEEVVTELDINLVLGMHAVPWPAPHTRPIGVTVHSADPVLLAGRQPWVGDLEVPGHVAGLLEITLDAAGHRSMGFVAHVPHYLSASEHPSSSVALLENVIAQTGLALPLDVLREAARRNDVEINAQVQGSDENGEAVSMLEAQFDALIATRGADLTLLDQTELPSGDDIAAQVEQFLAQRDAHGNDS